MPWHLPEDLAFFKRTTLGHAVVMGRKTHESIGRPLPKRRNLVLTRDPGWSAPGVEVIRAVEEVDAPALAGQRVFVIGGSEVYAAFLPRLDEIVISHLKDEYEGDVRFPEFEDRFARAGTIETHDRFDVVLWRRV